MIKQFARIPRPEPPLQLNELTEPELDVFRLGKGGTQGRQSTTLDTHRVKELFGRIVF